MKMYCCPRGTIHYRFCRYNTEVQFINIETKYNVGEPIVVNYTVQTNVCTSIRDWVGIFPRGWTDLQQYLTFVYTGVEPKCSPSSNKATVNSVVLFKTFHREPSPNIDYQFVYVSKEISVLGASSYFRFVGSPSLRSPDRKPDTPQLVNDDHLPSLASPRPIDAGKIVTKSRSIDNTVEQHGRIHGFLDQPQRTCRTCYTSVGSTFSANKAQFLSLINEQLMARVGRLDRDLELTEAALKTEKMAQMVLSKKLQTYEHFVGELFRGLNVTGFVRIRDNSKKEIIIQKVKSKELSSIVKSVPIPEVSMSHRSSEHKKWNDEETTETNKTEHTLQKVELTPNEAPRNEENVIYNSEIEDESMKVDVLRPLVEEQPPLDKEISITVPKTENDAAYTEQILNAAIKRKKNMMKLQFDVCRSNASKVSNDNPKPDQEEVSEDEDYLSDDVQTKHWQGCPLYYEKDDKSPKVSKTNREKQSKPSRVPLQIRRRCERIML